MSFFLPLTPKSCISAVLHRLIYGNWPRSGFIVIRRNGVYLVGRQDDLFEMILLDEPKTYRLIMKLCKGLSKGTFLDIGAHVGAYTIPIARLGLKVVAIEPSPDTFKLLEYNRRSNNLGANVLLINAAIWDHDGTAWLHQSVSHSGADSLFMIDHSTRVKVQAKSLSTLLEEIRTVDIAKMDIEGGELRVLEQARDSISKVATWIIEVRQDGINDVWKLMRKEGFNCRIIESLTRSRITYNILCYRKSSVTAEMKSRASELEEFPATSFLNIMRAHDTS